MPPVLVAQNVPFPGRSIREGEADPEIVIAVQRRLNAAGCGPIAEDGSFTRRTTLAVKRFQLRFTDADGLPLAVDGRVGPLTWSALFGSGPPGAAPAVPAVGPLSEAALVVARAEIGITEDPPGSNRGPRVDEYLRHVGLNPGGGSFAWCAAFVYFCFERSARETGRVNPLVRTAGVLAHWNGAERAGARRIKGAEAAAQPHLVRPGQIFVMDFGGGAGHTGLVAGFRSGKLVTIEGNTNDGGSREGIGVFERYGRSIGSINKGFISYE